ncbi:unnamed protein product [Parajaminaea phylloscopi]
MNRRFRRWLRRDPQQHHHSPEATATTMAHEEHIAASPIEAVDGNAEASTSTSTAPPAPELTAPTPLPTDSLPTFASIAHLLSPPILRALSAVRFSHPTHVQAQVLPLALSGHDIVARARTGSGKTLAYGLPVLQQIIQAKQATTRADPQYQRTRALILVPTRELAEQVTTHVARIAQGSEEDVRIVNVARDASSSVHALVLADRPDVVVSTPSAALKLVRSKTLSLESLQSLVLDEADLLLSYGHDTAVRALFAGDFLPKHYQSYLMSATMSQDVEELRGLLAAGGRKAAVLNLKDPTHHAHLRQYYVHLSEDSKFLLLYVLLRLRLVRGKVLIFVNDVDRGYKVRLFLEAFGVKSCVLNAEMPANSRYHVVQEFNKGVYDVIIATDESSSDVGAGTAGGRGEEHLDEQADAQSPVLTAVDPETTDIAAEVVAAEDEREDADSAEGPTAGSKRKTRSGEEDDSGAEDGGDATAVKSKKQNKDGKGNKKQKGDASEYGVSRGIDFVSVSAVVNFDLPLSLSAYIHRIGRTARGHSTGIALNFVVPRDLVGKRGSLAVKGLESPTAKYDERVWRRISRNMKRGGNGSSSSSSSTSAPAEASTQEGVVPWNVDWSIVDGFRYRIEDALRATTTRVKVREARVRDLKQELLRSERLKAHWEDNPRDFDYLRHDRPLASKGTTQAMGNASHLKHVPSYLLPQGARGARHAVADELKAAAPQDGAQGAPNSRVSYDEHGKSLGYVGMRKNAHRGGPGGRGRGGARGRGRGRGGSSHSGGGGGGGGRKKDPLRVGRN